MALGKTLLCMFISAILQDREFWVNMKALVERWSWKAICWWPWGCLDSAHSLFRSLGDRASSCYPQRQSFEPFSYKTELWTSKIVLVARWSWKGLESVTMGKTLICTFTVQDSGRQLWATPLEDRPASWYISFSGKMVLLRLFISDLGKQQLSMFIVHVSRRQCFELFSQETRPLSPYKSFSEKMDLERPCISDTRETSAHLFRSPRDRSHDIDMTLLTGRWSKKAVCQCHWGRLCSAYSLFWSPRRWDSWIMKSIQ